MHSYHFYKEGKKTRGKKGDAHRLVVELKKAAVRKELEKRSCTADDIVKEKP